MARCGCGGACSCALTAGDNITVSGSGTAANPWVVSATTDCTEVRACFTSGDGTTYNQSDGSFDVCISPTTPNALIRDANGCLRVVPGASTVTAGCGILGTGAPADPIRANTQTWPFACDLEAEGGGVYCDANGELRSEPPFHNNFFTESVNEILPGNGIAVPTATDTVVRTFTMDVTNPDPCRDAWVQLWQDVDLDIDLPVNGQAMYGIDGDDMWQMENQGNATMFSVHAQVGKLRSLSIPAGGTITISMDVTAGLGRSGARIRRIQRTLRAWVLSRNV